MGGTTTYFIYDGSAPVLEETYSGTTTTIQVANRMADGWRERYAATSFGFNAYGFDPQGSLTVEDSSFNTTLPAQNVYVFDGYGNRLVGERISSASFTMFNQDPVQFGGQDGYYTDVATGEVQLTHRYYDAATGHFLNRDPIGYNGGENLYAFCGNNPIMNSDPMGTKIVLRKSDPHEEDWRFKRDVRDYKTAIHYLMRAPGMAHRIRALEKSKTTYVVKTLTNGNDHFDGDKTVWWDPYSALYTLDNTPEADERIVWKRHITGRQSPALGLGHELLGHAYLQDQNPAKAQALLDEALNHYTDANERWVIDGIERQFALHMGEHPRNNHDGKGLTVTDPLKRY